MFDDTLEMQEPGIDVRELQQFESKILQARKVLSNAMHGTENEMLAIGAKLQEFLQSSQNIVYHSSETIDSISKDILEAGVAELNVLIMNFSTSLHKAADGLGDNKDKLSTILDSVYSILDGFRGFRRIIKQLKMLGVSTKIETSRLGSDDKGFTTIAENVERLAQLIDTKVSSIESKAKAITFEIVKTTNDLLLLEKEQRQQSKLIVDHTLATLNVFEDKHKEYLQKADTIKHDSSAIHGSIREIVTAIQFHDITRQQIEHVTEALEIASHEMSDINYSDSAQAKEQLGKVYDICSLQSEQMQHARDEFYLAVQNIIDQLHGIGQNVEDILKIAANLMNEYGSSGSSFGNIETDLLDILNGLMKNTEISWRLLASTKSVIATIEELTTSIQQIEEIGTEIELIALNARVRAAHTGANGASLGVLAEAIQKLSIDAKNQSESSTQLLSDIGKISIILREELDRYSEENSTESVNETHGLIKELLSNITAKGGVLTNRIGHLSGMVQNLEKQIATTTNGIRMHDQLQSKINEAVSAIAQVTNAIYPMIDARSDRHRNTGHLHTKYTMQSERMIHGKFTGTDTGSKSSSTAASAEFDDNIELF